MQVDLAVPTPYPWQQDIIDTYHKYKNLLLVVSRQAGKTYLARYLAMLQLLAGKKVVWVAPVFDQCRNSYRELHNTLEPLVAWKSKDHEMHLVTGGQILFKSVDDPRTIRSWTFDFAVLDEFAFTNDAEQVMAAVRPMLARANGTCLIISTPNGYNYFQQLHAKHAEDKSWLVRQLDHTCCPDLSAEYLEKERERLGENLFRQEYCATFLQGKNAIFTADMLQDLFVDEMPSQGVSRSCISTDFALGASIKSDLTGIVYLAWKDDVLYCDCRAERLPVDDAVLIVKQMYDMYRPEFVSFESNGFQTLVAPMFEKLFQIQPPVVLINNAVNKQVRISRLSYLLARKKLKLLNNSGGRMAFAQLADFPDPKQNDDIVDAIESGWRSLVES